MCRLLGIIANKPVDLEFSLARFKEKAERNPDGWGIGWYEGGEEKIFKQGVSALSPESRFQELSRSVRSKIIICHVRKGTHGMPAERNSHPFRYGCWIFAHNGCVDRDALLLRLEERYIREISGETDSEVYFYWILQCIEERGVHGIEEAVREAARGSGGLNFLLSDGRELYAFRYGGSLYMLRRDPSCGELQHTSGETGAMLKSKLLRGEKAVLICSENLTSGESWEEVRDGNLLVVDGNLNVKKRKIL